MRTKLIFLTSLFVFSSFSAYSQKKADKEILVFFSKGVAQKSIETKGKTQRKLETIFHQCKQIQAGRLLP